jgi:hypothetical protein
MRFDENNIHNSGTYPSAALSPVDGFTSRVFKQERDRWMLRLRVG